MSTDNREGHKQRVYTELDVRLGHVKLSPKLERLADQHLVPVLVAATRRELARIQAERAAAERLQAQASSDR